MSEIQITQVRLRNPPKCGCGQSFCGGDVIERENGVLLVCSSCHADALEIEIAVSSDGDEPWD
jgi:hypothetical protein